MSPLVTKLMSAEGNLKFNNQDMDTDGSNETVAKMNSTTESKDPEVKPSEPSRKYSKGDKLRKKDDKSVEQVLKALNSLETTEEKLAAMCKKYTDIVDENRKLQLAAKQCEKKCCILQREKEQLQTEHSKAVLSRSRLESLCRELQRQNKAIKEESLLKVREEEEKRKEVSAKFQGTLNEITALMQQNIEKNAKLKEENVDMAQRFGKLLEQYEIREQQVEKLLEQIHIETELGEAKMAKARMEMANEREVMLREKKQLLMDLDECRYKIRVLQEGEIGLRGQIRLYTDKYDEFQTALTRSSEVFNGFKGEMEKMSKKICKLEKETTSWKQRWECSHQALLEMAADKQQRDGELALANRRLTQMQTLCRTLQAERAALLVQLREKGEDVKDKEEDGSDKIKGSGTEIEEIKESNEAGNPRSMLGVAESVTKENTAIPDAVSIDNIVPGTTLDDGNHEVREISSLVESHLEEKVSIDCLTEPVISATEGNACSVSSNVKEDEKCIHSKAVKDDMAVSSSDNCISELSSNEKSEVSLISNIEFCKENLTDDSQLLNSSPFVNAVKEVENTDSDVSQALMREVELIKQQLDSCSINENKHPEVKVLSEERICEPCGDSQFGTCIKDREVLSDGNQNVCKGKELQGDIQGSSDVLKELKNVCVMGDEIQTNQGNEQSENVSSESLPTKNVNDKSVKSGNVNGDKLPEEEKNPEANVSADSDLSDKCGSQLLETSPDKCNSENEKEMKEKPLENVCGSSCSSKKPDAASLNMKKGKESSRKRKR